MSCMNITGTVYIITTKSTQNNLSIVCGKWNLLSTWQMELAIIYDKDTNHYLNIAGQYSPNNDSCYGCPNDRSRWRWRSRHKYVSLHLHHNGRDGVSNKEPQDCLLKHLVGRGSKKTSKLRVTGLCAGNSPGTGEFPAQMASYAENVSIGWRHHVSVSFTHVL